MKVTRFDIRRTQGSAFRDTGETWSFIVAVENGAKKRIEIDHEAIVGEDINSAHDFISKIRNALFEIDGYRLRQDIET